MKNAYENKVSFNPFQEHAYAHALA